MTAEPARLEIEQLTKRFGEVAAVDAITLSIEPGTLVSLLGPSGCGKTTLLRMIAGFELPDEGRITVASRDITSLPPNRRPTSLVFQRGALFPHRTVGENVAYPLRRRGESRARAQARALELLALVRLDGFADRRPSQLSGGQAQRVALARALAAEPAVLLLDEPLSALDLTLRKEMQLELRSLQRRLGMTFVFVTHDQEEALVLSDRIVVMNGGRIVQQGTPREIYDDPASAFVSTFIGESNVLRATVTGSPPDGDDDAVELNVGELALCGRRDAGVALDGAVAVSIRPERMRLAARRTEREAWNELDVTVEEVVFLGNRVRIRVSSALVQDLWVEQPIHDHELPDVRGAAMVLAWRADDTRVIAAD